MKKGQLSIETLIITFMVIVVFSALTPVLNYFVNYGSTQLGSYSTAATIIDLFPLAVAIGIFWGIFTRAKPYYDRYMGNA